MQKSPFYNDRSNLMRNIKELIPVIPICAILVVLMTAAIRDDNAKRVFCQNNLKKIYRFTLMYEKDHGGLPPVSVPTKPLWKFWPHYIGKYSTELRDFACPSDPRNEPLFARKRTPLLPEKRIACSYGMNYFLTEHFAKKRGVKPFLANLSKPSRTILHGDSKGPYMLPERFWTYEQAMRHDNETGFFSFGDGHVARMKQSDFGKKNAKGVFQSDFSKWHWL